MSILLSFIRILYVLELIETKGISEEFDDPTPPKPRSVYIFPMFHLSKQGSLVKYLKFLIL